MAKRHLMPEMKEGGVNVTPLIDVVMCLIIFFMLVAKIGVATGAEKMELPESLIGMKLEKVGATLIINVKEPNAKSIKTPIVTAMLEQDKDQGKAKEIKLFRFMEGSDKVADHPLRRVLEPLVKMNKDFSVTVRAEKQLEFGMLQQVLAEIAEAGVRNVNYATMKKG